MEWVNMTYPYYTLGVIVDMCDRKYVQGRKGN